MDKISQF